jgi:hypothetical protein
MKIIGETEGCLLDRVEIERNNFQPDLFGRAEDSRLVGGARLETPNPALPDHPGLP